VSYPSDPALAFRNMVIESAAGMAASVAAGLVLMLIYRRAPDPVLALVCGAFGVCAMNAAHDRLGGNRGSRP